MALVKMQRLQICALKTNRKQILEYLQMKEVFQLEENAAEDEIFKRIDTSTAKAKFMRNVQLADGAIAILDTYAPEKTGLLDSLAGRTPVERLKLRETVASQREIMGTVNEIQGLAKEAADLKAAILKLENRKEMLAPWMPLDISMACRGTKSTALLFGMLPSQITVADILQHFKEKEPEILAEVQLVSQDKEQIYLCVICQKKYRTEAEDALRELGFIRPSNIEKGIPAKVAGELEAEIGRLREKCGETEAKLAAMGEKRAEIRRVADYYRIRGEKYELLGRLMQSDKTFILEGYIPKRNAGEVVEYLNNHFTLSVEVTELAPNEEAPVLFYNNVFSESVEGIVASFGLPGKKEFDPTTVMSFFYVFFFGLMLSDAGYGLLVSIVCFALLKMYPHMEAGMRKAIKMFGFCGLSTLFWGIMFGGFFGDLVDTVSRVWFGHEVTLPALWFVPLNDPVRLLLWCMIFGLIHLFTGMILKGYILVKDKAYVDFICDVVIWLIFLTGLIMLFVGSSLFSSIFGITVNYSPAMNLVTKVLAIGGALGVVLTAGRSSKNVGLRFALGLYGLYDITSWLSDILSYSRLLALGLATGVIAQVINMMGSMAGNSIVGAIVFIIVFIFGTALNMVINIFGAYVHTNRLQYVEFFGKFYEGGGKAFEPFGTHTKYVKFKED